MKRAHLLLAGTAAVLALVALGLAIAPAVQRQVNPKTVDDRLREYGPAARARLQVHFQKHGIPYPPRRVVLVGVKAEKRLQVYAAGPAGPVRFLRDYPIRAASGELGPKLQEGDLQVPEGIYPIELLNPNSRFHLSLRVGYPNAFDRAQAARDGRTRLGGDIMIHGKAVSIGCLAMGDEAAEDLFVLAADTGLKNIQVILTPVDFRRVTTVPAGGKRPAWTAELYDTLRKELSVLPPAP